MGQALTVKANPRDPAKNKGTGSRAVRKLRSAGLIPAIVYGHKQDNLPITLTREDVWALIKEGHHVAQLRIGEQTEMALIRDVQWDHLGRDILHLDFYRVSADERVTTDVSLVLHGTAPGLSEGGALEQPAHTVRVSCTVTAIPDSIRVDVGNLHLNDAIKVRDLPLPEGVSIVGDPDMVLVHVVLKKAAVEAAAGVPGAEGAVQPEVIGRKEKEKKDGEDETPAKK